MNFNGLGAPLSPTGLQSVCDALGVDARTTWAVASVETRGCGFFASRRPQILFERHVFRRLTNHVFDQSNPALSNPTPGGYNQPYTDQYLRLDDAMALNKEAALQSASWGSRTVPRGGIVTSMRRYSSALLLGPISALAAEPPSLVVGGLPVELGNGVAASIAVALLIWFALMFPLIRYLLVGWRAKRVDIMDGLDAEARLAYFEMFCRAEPTPQDPTSDFEKMYTKWYGKRFFVVPTAVLGVFALAATSAVTFTCLHAIGYLTKNPLVVPIPDAAVAALAGSYLWISNDLISRARRLDLTPSDVQWSILRLIISIPMGYAFASLASPSVGPFVAFGLGAFPLTALVAMLQRLTNKSLGTDPASPAAHDDVIKIQGVNPAIAERLAFEDVTTVTQIAYCDPVRIVMRSNLTFNFVTDCMSQAIAWLYLEDRLDVVRPMGMRGAVEIKEQMDDFDNVAVDPASAHAHVVAVIALQKMADALKQDVSTLEVTFRQIAEDPFTKFLHRVWT